VGVQLHYEIPSFQIPKLVQHKLSKLLIYLLPQRTSQLKPLLAEAGQEYYPSDLVKRADADRWSDWASTVAANPMGELWRGIVRTAPGNHRFYLTSCLILS